MFEPDFMLCRCVLGLFCFCILIKIGVEKKNLISPLPTTLSIFRPISEFFLIRDTSLIPNILWFEYTVTRAEAR